MCSPIRFTLPGTFTYMSLWDHRKDSSVSNSLKILVLASVFLASCTEKKQQNDMAAMMMEPAAVRSAPVTQSDVPLDISAVGNVESMATVDVKSRVAGQVLRVAFQEGQNVEK